MTQEKAAYCSIAPACYQMNDFLNLTESAVDTVSLGHVLHERGINIRYLGVISGTLPVLLCRHFVEPGYIPVCGVQDGLHQLT